MSAHAALWDNFDFNATPLAPPGTKARVHLKPHQRKSFGAHGIDGWYVGPSRNYYRCYKCWIRKTGGTRDADTVEFFPQQIPFPKVSPDDYLHQAATDIHHILQNAPKNFPHLSYHWPFQEQKCLST